MSKTYTYIRDVIVIILLGVIAVSVFSLRNIEMTKENSTQITTQCMRGKLYFVHARGNIFPVLTEEGTSTNCFERE